ncbi:g7526 [Coccomyxa viridis]|uniref:G7526 protein n=1 Tax=Coccomyxa viridis TaxID=1274662 RepID=A0ABP1FY18_9CHLO
MKKNEFTARLAAVADTGQAIANAQEVCPKGPFSGSEVAFSVALPEGAAATERAQAILGLVEDVMEPLTMVAPPVAVQLRIKGFHEQVLHPHVPLCLQAFFVTPAEISAENENASEPAPSTPQIYTSPCITTTGVAISVFQNYAVLQRPLQPLLKALERVDWASFGLSGIVGEGVNAAHLTFAPGSEETYQLMRALVVHLVPPDMPASPAKSRRQALGLSAQTEAKLVKAAVTKALQAVKGARPLSLQSGFEQRMGCLADISRSISAVVAQSKNAEFREAACSIAGTDLHSLRDSFHEALEAIALASISPVQARDVPGRGQQAQGIL